jgi:hypothetical protein
VAEFNALHHNCGDALSLGVGALSDAEFRCSFEDPENRGLAVVKKQAMRNSVGNLLREFHAHVTWRIDGTDPAPYSADGLGLWV